MSDRGKQRDKGGKDLKKDISKGLGELKRKKIKDGKGERNRGVKRETAWSQFLRSQVSHKGH